MDDEELVARIRAGDFDAANALLARYTDVTYTLALRLMGHASDAEDLTQDALVRAYTHLDELHDSANFSAWLRRITINLSLNALRRRGQFQAESLDTVQLDGSSREIADSRQPTPEDAALRDALRGEITALLLQLPATQRVAVVLRDMYDYDVAEIATLQQCGVSAAKMRIMRGRALLRQKLVNERAVSWEGEG